MQITGMSGLTLKIYFPHPYTAEEADKWFELVKKLPENTIFAIVLEGKAIGGIGIHLLDDVHKHCAEIGYWVGEDYWNRGIATEAVRKMTAFAFDNFDINRIFARVFDWNQSSAKVLTKNNFQLEGRLRKSIYKDGVFTDELVYGLLRLDL
jgi:[ribosomal protein S5]-alanine N-acetyltransferase